MIKEVATNARRFLEAQDNSMLTRMTGGGSRAIPRDRMIEGLLKEASGDEIFLWSTLADTEPQIVTLYIQPYWSPRTGDLWYLPGLMYDPWPTPYEQFIYDVTLFSLDEWECLDWAVEAHRSAAKIENVRIVWRYY